ncbi:hypothetical protein L7F22_008532 [Adiantum nelumboides]|nr:hypothetical protein [Adiantum nelumboides]
MIACRKLRRDLLRNLLAQSTNRFLQSDPLSKSLSKSALFSQGLKSSSNQSRFLQRFTTDGHAYSRAFSSLASDSTPRFSSKTANVIGNVILVVVCGVATYYCFPRREKPPALREDEHVVTNWSGTHEVKTNVYIQPESLEELEIAVNLANEQKQKLRPVGSGLSPNGIALCKGGMVNLALMDKILDIDVNTKLVTVQAGARVEQVVEALRPHGLTLQNFASIKQQQIGGFTQVGAHGTGAKIPPVDEQVVRLKMVTPAKGTLELSAEKDPDLFYLARCSLGTLGVVAEVTLQCVPVQRLLEHTFVTTKKEVRKRHKNWLQENKHLRYMWIPDTDCVVVVKCNPLPEGKKPPVFKSKFSEEDRLEPVRSLYKQCALKYRVMEEGKPSDESKALRKKDEKSVASSMSPSTVKNNLATLLPEEVSDDELAQLSFTELRDKLLAMDPLSREHVMQVNRVEAEYWKRCEGFRVGWTDEILGFDCGGHQWVSEVCLPVGSYKKPSAEDITFMENLLDLIKKNGIPAPAPIEQRWSARSRSLLSPAHSPVDDSIFSWVGIIMYLPTDDAKQREAITNKFLEYRRAAQRDPWDVFGAYEHWAKLEVEADDKEWLQERLMKHFPIDKLNKARKELDPYGILSNDIIDQLFPLTAEKAS